MIPSGVGVRNPHQQYEHLVNNAFGQLVLPQSTYTKLVTAAIRVHVNLTSVSNS